MYRYQCKFCNYEWSTEQIADIKKDLWERFTYCPDCKQVRDVIPI